MIVVDRQVDDRLMINNDQSAVQSGYELLIISHRGELGACLAIRLGANRIMGRAIGMPWKLPR
ncbi:hypothetical protein H6G52_11795 [Limnothrix sp. FACHB-881]|uniref:hypothetical protein n=1 Tax=Limnothrix redekei TaxID=132606 RepID=UPI00198E8B10|nr:hypothetical protein [Limnothrix sp. FACHB-881]